MMCMLRSDDGNTQSNSDWTEETRTNWPTISKLTRANMQVSRIRRKWENILGQSAKRQDNKDSEGTEDNNLLNINSYLWI